MTCPACGHENRDAAKFCEECAAPVRGSSGRAEPGRTPRAHTPGHLAERILAARSALEGERKQITVLFADLKGSMELAERLDPEEWHRLMDRFFAILAEGVHRFEGTVNQFLSSGSGLSDPMAS